MPASAEGAPLDSHVPVGAFPQRLWEHQCPTYRPSRSFSSDTASLGFYPRHQHQDAATETAKKLSCTRSIKSFLTPLRAANHGKIKILFVSANPAGTTQLKLDEEVREIEAKIRAAEHRESLELITKWAARPDDLLQALNQHKPHVVHFSGHGSSTEEIIFLDRLRNPKPVSKEALVNLFRTLKDNIRVVLLNACFSKPQAEAITGEIDFTIGMMRAIGDDAAITFAASFYRAIGFGRSVKEAFDQGITALLLDGSSEGLTPVLMSGKNAAPDKVFLVNPQ
jgi:CHAT domain-containing protein